MTTEVRETEAELLSLLDDSQSFSPEDGQRHFAFDALAERLGRDEDWTLAFIARRMTELMAKQDAIGRQRDAMLDHFNQVDYPLTRELEQLDAMVSDVLIARRRRNPAVKSLLLLGIGEWKSRKVSDGWDIDEKVVLPKLTPDETAQLVEQRPHLKTAELRALLDGLLAPAKRSLDEDAPAEERTERLKDITDALAEQYGVAYRPERLSVKGPLS